MPNLAASTISARPVHRTDEDFINRSLLDSLDAQADAEPVSSSSDSEAAAANSFGSASNSSSGSPSVPYHITMQQQPLSNSSTSTDSDNTLLSHNHLSHKPPHPDSLFNIHSAQNQTHAMYNNIHDFAPSDQDVQKLQQSGKLNGFGPPSTNAYRQSAFAAFTNNTRPRHHTSAALSQPPYRDAASAFGHTYPTAADVFGTSGPPTLSHMTSPTLSQQQANSYETLHQGRGFDYNGGGSQSNGALNKQTYSMGDPYGNAPSGLLQIGGSKSGGGMPATHNGYSLPSTAQAPYVNGLHIQSQTPYGPHLPTNGPPPNSTNGGTNGVPPGISHVNGVGNPPNAANEEISTIFVVGFPEDMQVRHIYLYLFWSREC
jgi:hypothetical protein